MDVDYDQLALPDYLRIGVFASAETQQPSASTAQDLAQEISVLGLEADHGDSPSSDGLGDVLGDSGELRTTKLAEGQCEISK
jgi:hypothetical protein